MEGSYNVGSSDLITPSEAELRLKPEQRRHLDYLTDKFRSKCAEWIPHAWPAVLGAEKNIQATFTSTATLKRSYRQLKPKKGASAPEPEITDEMLFDSRERIPGEPIRVTLQAEGDQFLLPF